MNKQNKTTRKTMTLIAGLLAALISASPVMAGDRYDDHRGHRDRDSSYNYRHHRYQDNRYAYKNKGHHHHKHHGHGHGHGHGHRHVHHYRYPFVRYYADDDAAKWFSVAAVTIKVLDNINEDKEREHESGRRR